MRIFNFSRKRLVCEDCIRVSPLLGLMFQRPHPVYFVLPVSPLLRSFSRYPALHTFFVFGSIDVFFLKNNRVVDIKRNFRPFTFYTSKAIADTVVELPVGMARQIDVGDGISIS